MDCECLCIDSVYNSQVSKIIPIHSETAMSCSSCAASCCRLEVMIVTDTGVPEQFIARDGWGSETMLRLDDGWCAALDRHTMLCSIYELRPLICREFAEGGYECIDQVASVKAEHVD